MKKFIYPLLSILFIAASCTVDETNTTVLRPSNVDTDMDTILDVDEDLDGDGDPSNDDTDNDGVANFMDPDDDGDSVPTITEVVEGDTDGDGTQDYLDTDDDNDRTPTIDEDYNCDQSVLDDDLDNDGITDYLDDNFGLLLVAEDDMSNDTTEAFDLTALENAAIAASGATFSQPEISYYLTRPDADGNLNALFNTTSFNNSTNPQDIFIRIEDSASPNQTFVVVRECFWWFRFVLENPVYPRSRVLYFSDRFPCFTLKMLDIS